MFKKILCLTMAAALLTMHITVCADGDTYSYTDESGVVYEYTVSDNEATITKIDNVSSKLTIPEKVGDYTVTKLGKCCCDENIGVSTLVIPSSVKEIGDSAFEGCEFLWKVTFSEGLEKIDDYAFQNCNQLEELDFPSSIKEIGVLSFSYCPNLIKVVFPETLPTIETSAFYQCKSLTDVNIDPKNTSVDLNVFSGSAWLQSFYGENDNSLSEDGKTYCKYSGTAEDVVIPDGVTTIAAFAFQDSNAKHVTIPESVTVIPDYAFWCAGNLETVEIKGAVTSIGDDAFAKSGLKKITIPDTVTKIADHAFYNCLNLESITIPASVKSLGKCAFYGDTALKSVTIKTTGLESIGLNPFGECYNLTTVTLPSVFEDLSFEDSSHIGNLFPANGKYVTTLNYDGEFTKLIFSMFYSSAVLSKYADNNGFVILGDTLLKYTGDNKNVNIPEGIKTINHGAFRRAEIESVTFPSTLETIGSYAFVSCNNLKSITIPSNVKTVSENAFQACLSLETVVIEKGVGEIGSSVFEGCSELKNVTYYEGTKIAESAFEDTPYAKGLSATAAPDATEKPKATAEPDATEAPDATAKPTVAPTAAPEILTVKTGEKLEIDIDGKSVAFTDAQPFIDANSRTQVPVRAVSEMLGCTVEWDDATKTATISNGDKTVSITIGSDTITVNGKSVKMDTAAVIANDRTYIPVRYAAEALGMTVQWE